MFGATKRTHNLFEWTKISSALFDCLGMLEVNRKETPITGAIDPETIVHKISSNDEIPYINKSSVCSPYKSHGFLTT